MEVGSPLSAWESFYVIVGTSAAALTGLQFIVVTLVSESTVRTGTRELDAFATPTIVHFCMVLLLSAAISAPWPSLFGLDVVLAGAGLYGIAYVANIVRRTRVQTGYVPVLEDWIWHVILPAVAYTTLVLSAALLRGYSVVSLFLVGAVSVLLMFIGIHNAWDTVTYVATLRSSNEGDSANHPPAPPPPPPPPAAAGPSPG
jgi:hypothetical protein